MYSWRKWINLEVVGAVLLLLLVFLLLGKIQVGEHSEGFYIIRPTYWVANPTEVNVEFTSFYPTTLSCEINTPYGSFSKTIDPRSSFVVILKGEFSPNSYVTIPITIDCGVIKEEGTIVAFVFT